MVRNTEAFLHGRGGNNVLLYGDAGTGKSTSVQAIANEYAAKGLRLIEVYKEQYDLIPALLRQIKGRNYRFLLFLDDLSFEENETSYNFILKKHQPPLAPTANGGYFCCVSFNMVTSASIYIAAAAEH